MKYVLLNCLTLADLRKIRHYNSDKRIPFLQVKFCGPHIIKSCTAIKITCTIQVHYREQTEISK